MVTIDHRCVFLPDLDPAPYKKTDDLARRNQRTGTANVAVPKNEVRNPGLVPSRKTESVPSLARGTETEGEGLVPGRKTGVVVADPGMYNEVGGIMGDGVVPGMEEEGRTGPETARGLSVPAAATGTTTTTEDAGRGVPGTGGDQSPGLRFAANRV